MVTNLLTGQPEYRPVPRRDEKFLLLQATCAMPVLFRPSGWTAASPIWTRAAPTPSPGGTPWTRAATRVVVVLTRERSYRKEPEKA